MAEQGEPKVGDAVVRYRPESRDWAVSIVGGIANEHASEKESIAIEWAQREVGATGNVWRAHNGGCERIDPGAEV